MKIDDDVFSYDKLPFFIKEANILKEELLKKNLEELKLLWKCSDKLLYENYNNLNNMDLYNKLGSAVLSYQGLQFQYMAPSLFMETEFNYVRKHLRILSGMYGLLEPFDGITSYRLEMQSKLEIDGIKNLYDFWGNKITDKLKSETDLIINLASDEYSKVIKKDSDLKIVSIFFKEIKDNKLIEKGTLCKMARGEMVRFMAENNIIDIEGIKSFNRLNYEFNSEYSTNKELIFIKKVRD